MKLSDITTEKDFISTVIDYAQFRGWIIYHQFEQAHYARRIGQGFPDLVLVRNRDVAFSELKSENGMMSIYQSLWAKYLGECGTYTYHLWRPSDWEEIIERLR